MDGAELRRLRERLELSADQFAAELDVPTEMLRRWEAGEACIPRRRARDIPAHVARADRERQRVRSRHRPRRRQHTSRLVFLAPACLLFASVIGYLPFSHAWLIVLYPLSLVVGGFLLINVYEALPRLRGAGATGRWMARCVAGAGGMIGFVGTYLVSGYSEILTPDGPLSFPAALLLGVGIGLLYATFWPLAKSVRGYW